MRRRISLFVAFIGVVGLLGLNPAAQATHDGAGANNGKKDNGKHEGMPTPPSVNAANIDATCAVRGVVSIGNSQSQGALTGGVEATSKNHNHYRFFDTEIICNAVPQIGNPALTATFDVDAAGGTDGPASSNPISVGHGEDDVNGWSHGDCYTGRCTSWWGNKKLSFTDLYTGANSNPAGSGQCTNCGEISIDAVGANPTASTSPANWVKFTRVGSLVTAWGALNVTAGDKNGEIFCFLTELNFRPTNGGPTASPSKKIDAAELTGTAVVWDAKDVKSNCSGGKGQKR